MNTRSVMRRLVLPALLGLGSAYAQEPLTFESALSRLQTYNEALKAGEQDIRQWESARAAAKGLRAPKVEAEVRDTVLNAPIAIGIDPIPISLQVQEREFVKGQVKVSMPLYAGGRINAANAAAEARVDEARAEQRRTEHALATELAQRYYGLQLAEQARQVAAMRVATMEAHVFQARRLMEEGVTARVEFLNAGVGLANARSDLAAAESDVAIASEGLMNTLAAKDPVKPESPLFLLPGLESKEIFVSYISAEHPVLAMLDAKQRQAKEGVRAEEGAMKPSVYLFGMHEMFRHDLTMLDPEWAVGVGAQYTIFDGHQGRNKVAAAKALSEKAAILRGKYERDLKSLAVKRYEELEKARNQYDAMGETLVLTGENLRVRTRAFEEGVATSVDVVDAALSHQRAQLGRVKAAYDYDLALFQLLEASGRLSNCMDYVSRGVPVPALETPPPAAPPLKAPLQGANPTEATAP